MGYSLVDNVRAHDPFGSLSLLAALALAPCAPD
jgi:hypothetical protein